TRLGGREKEKDKERKRQRLVAASQLYNQREQSAREASRGEGGEKDSDDANDEAMCPRIDANWTDYEEDSLVLKTGTEISQSLEVPLLWEHLELGLRSHKTNEYEGISRSVTKLKTPAVTFQTGWSSLQGRIESALRMMSRPDPAITIGSLGSQTFSRISSSALMTDDRKTRVEDPTGKRDYLD
ncbi:hypothetical protein ALC56_12134, partial [Trachymyrmex septentrionalis]